MILPVNHRSNPDGPANLSGGHATATDMGLVRKVVEASLLTPGASLVALTPTYARLKGEDGELVAYRIRIGTDQGEVDTAVSVRSGPPHRLRAQAMRFSDSRAATWTAPLVPWHLDAEVGLLLIAFPLDRVLRDLRRLVDLKWVRRALEGHGVLEPRARRMSRSRSRLSMVSYRPERRAVVRLDAAFGSGEEDQAVFLRTHRDPAFAERSQAALRALHAEGLPVPAPLGRPEPALALEGLAAGRTLDAFDLCRPARARSVGRLLARVHRTRAPGDLLVQGEDQVVEQGRTCAQRLAEVHPELGARALAVAQTLGGACPGPDDRCLVHGDMHPGQLLGDDETLSLVDWDRAHAGHPAQDLASFRTRLWLQNPEEADDALRYVAEGYADVSPLPDPGALRWHEGQALLRLADTPHRRMLSSWIIPTTRIVERLESLP